MKKFFINSLTIVVGMLVMLMIAILFPLLHTLDKLEEKK